MVNFLLFFVYHSLSYKKEKTELTMTNAAEYENLKNNLLIFNREIQ